MTIVLKLMMIMMVLVVLSRIRKCHWIVPFPLESQWEQLVAINARKRWMPATDTRHETICDDDENMSKFRIIPQNSSTDSRLCGTIFLQFHFANGSSSLLLEYLKSFPDENFTAGNLHFNAFDLEKFSQLSFLLTETLSNLTNWPHLQFSSSQFLRSSPLSVKNF